MSRLRRLFKRSVPAPVPSSQAAEAAAKANDWPEAERLWQAELDSGNDAPSTWVGLSTAQRKQGRFSRAEQTIASGLKKYPEHLGLRNEQADIAHSASQWPEAVKRWSKILKDFPDRQQLAAVYVRLSDAYSRQAKFAEADKVITEGLLHHPDNPHILLAYARVAAAKQDWSEAGKRWQSVIDKFGDQSPAAAWANLAEAYRHQKKYAEAKQVLQTGLKALPNNIELRLVLGEVAIDEKAWLVALKVWQAIETDLAKPDMEGLRVNLYVRANVSLLKRLAKLKDYKTSIKTYAKRKEPAKIAVYTSFTAGYDELKLPEKIDPRIDYFIFSDDPVDGLGVYQVRPLNQPEFKMDGSRATRYPKTHPHVLFPDYDAAVWVDASLMIVGDIIPTVHKVLASSQPVGNGTHPHRQSLMQELEACIDLKKDDPAVLKRQIEFYKKEGFETDDLANGGVLIFNIKHPKLAPAMDTWWEQIIKFSKRDQLSFNYALWKNKTDRFRLTKPPQDIRDHPLFVFVPHHSDNKLLNLLNKLVKT